MKVLLAIMSCQAYTARAQAQRDTWVKDIPIGMDYQFFIGLKPGQERFEVGPDTVLLEVPDDYLSFPAKVQAMRRWAYDHGYDFVAKVDDDVYLEPGRLLASLPSPHEHYKGRTRGPSGGFRAPYNSGFCYWLDRFAIEKIKDLDWIRGKSDGAEDRWSANALLDAGIRPAADYRHVVVSSKRNAISGREAPLCDNDIISACEYEPAPMKAAHTDYKNGRVSAGKNFLPQGVLGRVSVMIKTFLRDGYLYECLRGIERRLPECEVIVVDDGLEHPNKITRYGELRAKGHQTLWMPFDSGFGEKANLAVSNLRTDFVLIGSDDFDFGDKQVRAGIDLMVKVMDANPKIGVASGRVNGKPYEFCFDKSEPGVVKEVAKFHSSARLPNNVPYHFCDLTVNYSLIRRKVFESGVKWDGGAVKIGGGEHAAFFLDIEERGWKVAVVEGAFINELRAVHGMDPSYPKYRARARQPGRPCLKRRGVNRYIMASGIAEEC